MRHTPEHYIIYTASAHWVESALPTCCFVEPGRSSPLRIGELDDPSGWTAQLVEWTLMRPRVVGVFANTARSCYLRLRVSCVVAYSHASLNSNALRHTANACAAVSGA